MRTRINVIVAASGIMSVAAAAHADLPTGVAAGDVTQQAAVLWTRSDTTGQVSFEVSLDPNFASILRTVTAIVSDTLLPAKVNIDALAPGQRYYYRATDSSGRPSGTASGTFLTPRETGAGFNGFRFGVGGDWGGADGQFPAVSNVANRNLNVFVKLGDTLYADIPSPAVPASQARTLEEFRRKHVEVISTRAPGTGGAGINHWQRVNASTAVLAIIDDHEVTDDFAGYNTVSGDGRFAEPGQDPSTRLNRTSLFRNGVQAFHEYMPIRNETWQNTGADPRMDGTAKLYRAQSYGKDAAVFLVDARSYRDTRVPDYSGVLDITNPSTQQAVGAYLQATANPSRTMLGGRQFDQLTTDLLTAQQNGVTWKFVHLPQPIQNLGIFAASDRFEGYAAERNRLLAFIDGANPTGRPIDNVVFVSADIHGSVVNNLTYTDPTNPRVQRSVKSFEITTAAAGYVTPFGVNVAAAAAQLDPRSLPLQQYLSLPMGAQEMYVQSLYNQQLSALGYSPIGLEDSGLNYQVLQTLPGANAWSSTNTYGWTEFDVDAITQDLTVTTWGVPWYDASLDPNIIGTLQPQIISQFRVAAIPTPGVAALLALGGLAATRRRRA